MSRQGSIPVQHYGDFVGGLNNIMSQAKVADNESPSLQNIEFVENGIPGKRRGTAAYGNSVGAYSVSCLASQYLSSGARNFLMVANGTLYQLSGTTWGAVTGKTFATGQVNVVQVNDSAYLHDGTNSMGKYDGTTLSTPSTGVTASFGIFFQGKHVASGNPTNPSRLYIAASGSPDDFIGSSGTATGTQTSSTIQDTSQSWTTNEFAGLTVVLTSGTGAGQSRAITSNTGNTITVGTVWTTTPDTTSKYTIDGGNTIDISKNDGQKITGLAKFYSNLIVFKERSIYQLSFDSSDNPTVQLVTALNGCVSHRSIDVVENDIYFLANDGVRSLGYVPYLPGIIRTTKMSLKINASILNINSSYYSGCCGIYFDNKYFLSYPSGSSKTNDTVIVFQLLYGSWTLWNGINCNYFDEFVDTSNKVTLYSGTDTNAQVVQMLSTVYTDQGAAINGIWYSKQYDLGAFDLSKRYLFLDIQVRSLTGTLGIDVILDGSVVANSPSISSTFTSKDGIRIFQLRTSMERQQLGSSALYVATDDTRRIKVNKQAKTIQVRVYNDNPGETFTVMGIGIGYRSLGPNRFDSSKILY